MPEHPDTGGEVWSGAAPETAPSTRPGLAGPGPAGDRRARFDVAVIGAGPAGSAAALVLARAGLAVALVERGPFAGSKNMFGGVVHGRILDTLVPRWWEEIPFQRWITRRATMVITPSQSVTVDVRSQAWGAAPHNGCTTFRPDFDAWLAGKAEAEGAVLVTSTTATGLLRGADGHIAGVTTDRPDGDLLATVVIACDGVNSLLAKEAGLFGDGGPGDFTLGVKEVLALPRQEIDRRFGLRGDEGADFQILGATGDVPGGGFLSTNAESLAIGVVLGLPELGRSSRRPEEVIAELKAHPAIAPLVEGTTVTEYSAHLIGEGGYDAMPSIVTDHMMVAGDAAGLCLAAGIWLEGVNFAIASGAAAGRTAVEALAGGDTSARGLAGYRRRLETTFVLADHKRLRSAPALVMAERTQRTYPRLICDMAERMFTVTNPAPKTGLLSAARRAMRGADVRVGDVARDAWSVLRTFG